MFEAKPVDAEDNKRGNLIVGALGLVAITLIVGVFYIAGSKGDMKPPLPNGVWAGSAEFEHYKSKIEIEVIDKIVHPNMIGMMQYEIRTRVTNRGDRTLTGLELIGRMIGLDDKVIKESISVPIPRVRTEPLKPGESIKVSVKIDGPGNVSEGQVKDLLVELRGLQF
ncbi:MAG: hypothetical protein HYR56_25590 [Acidobacteria bacterium]|nr:hypothetical protein [Acidobacteriota bacterium]MBI3423292.1 hypothetical protein [Acidobacteriota bacterium]